MTRPYNRATLRVTRRTIRLFSLLVALAVFCGVQDRITAAGARRYVAVQRDALAGRRPVVTIDAVMRPAIARGVSQGLIWGAVALATGLALAAVRRERK